MIRIICHVERIETSGHRICCHCEACEAGFGNLNFNNQLSLINNRLKRSLFDIQHSLYFLDTLLP